MLYHYILFLIHSHIYVRILSLQILIDGSNHHMLEMRYYYNQFRLHIDILLNPNTIFYILNRTVFLIYHIILSSHISFRQILHPLGTIQHIYIHLPFNNCYHPNNGIRFSLNKESHSRYYVDPFMSFHNY